MPGILPKTTRQVSSAKHSVREPSCAFRLRIRVSWADDSTLKLETDAGQQTRVFNFDKAKQPGRRRPGRDSQPPNGHGRFLLHSVERADAVPRRQGRHVAR